MAGSEPHPPSRPARLVAWFFPGDRLVWRAGAVFVVIGACLLGWYALAPRPYLTGTTGSYTRSSVASLERGSRLCLPGLRLPADTRRIQLDLGGAGGPRGRPPATVVVSTGGREAKTRVPAGLLPNFERVTVGVPPPGPARPGSGVERATLCVTAKGGGGLTVGGMEGGSRLRPRPTVDGRPLDARVAAWFLPAAGSEKSIAELFPQIARRAALFRPGPFGAWVYWALLLLVPVAAWLVVRALAAPRGRAALASIALVGLVSGASWALTTSPFDAPDEAEHFAALQYQAETGRAVDRAVTPARSPYSSEQAALLDILNHFSTIESPEGKKPWLEAESEAFRRLDARGPPVDDGGGAAVSTSAGNNLYYLLLTPGYEAARPGGILATVLAGRLVSTLLLLVVAFCAFATVRELFPARNRLAVAAGLLVVAAPVLSFIGGAVHTDMGVNAADALLIYLVIRAMRRGASPLLLAGIGLTVVVAILTKATAYALVPATILGVAVALARAGRGALVAAGALAAGLGVGLAVKLGVTALLGDPVVGKGAPGLGPPVSVASQARSYLSYTWQTFFPPLPGMLDRWTQPWPFFEIYVKRGFGAFGWYAYTVPSAALWSVVAAMGGVIGSGIYTLARAWRSAWRFKWEIAFFIVLLASVLGGVAAVYQTLVPRPLPAEQGRYAFPAAVAVATLTVGAFIGLGPVVRRWVVVGLVVGMGVLGVMGRLAYLAGAYS